jgi:uncharacterized membrane protein YjjP (DUF1212 family)
MALESSVGPADTLDLLLKSATLLFVYGQTTRKVIGATTRLAGAMGFRARVFPHWDDLAVRIEGREGSIDGTVEARPTNVDMHRVAEAMDTIDVFCSGKVDVAGARSALKAIAELPPVSTVRFALMAAAGAAALGVIFGEANLLNIGMIALSAGAGAWLRRWLARISQNVYVQPFCAAVLAGSIGAAVDRLQLSSPLHLVALCPCMVLVPGPHILNGAIDLSRARLALGTWRMVYASLIVLMICAGLLLGLSLGGFTVSVFGPVHPVPLGYDVIAAGVAVAAYGTFFSMPWRMLPIPIGIGMLAHACRWVVLTFLGASVATGAFVACVIVGSIVTPIADRRRLPFGAFAFASVVSLIPGVYLFRMAGGLVGLVMWGAHSSPDQLLGTVVDGATAGWIILAITFGLLIPKILLEHFLPSLSDTADF